MKTYNSTQKAKMARKKWVSEHPLYFAIKVLKRNASRRNLPVEISDTLIEDLVTDNCFYCGSKPNPLNGIDRIDNTKGYIFDNVVTACIACNIAKTNSPVDEFLERSMRISQRFPNGKLEI